MMKSKRAYPLIILSLVFLSNPNMNLIDILPDCIAYTLFAIVIGDLAQTIPYLAECKGAVIKLALVTLIKIPAFSVMYTNMRYGSDIVTLFTFSFAVLEFILLYGAVKNLFLAMSYIGERTDCESVREKFPLTKKIKISPEALEQITLIFFIIKGALNVLPELLLLSKESFMLRKQLRDAYPAVLVLSVLAALIIGIIWLVYVIKYVKNIKRKNDLLQAIEEIELNTRPEISSSDKMLKKLIDALNLLAISSIFIFDISVQDYGGRNILPHFIYGLVLFYAISNLTENKTYKLLLTVFATGFSISAIVNQSLTARFFGMYQYVDLSYSKYAKADYVPIKMTALSEAIFILAMTVLAAVVLVRFIKEHTEVLPSDPAYGESVRRAHRRLIKITLPLMIISGVINVMKCVNVFLMEKITVIYSEVNPEGIATSSAPALNTVIFLLSIIFVIYSFVVISTLKEEVRFKYSK